LFGLSSPDGVVHVDYSVQNDELLLTWKERGGPSLSGSPNAEGFGSVLAHRIVTQHFGGRLSTDWKVEGLDVRMSVPLERLNS
jgi:two-component sensor histidine kinase